MTEPDPIRANPDEEPYEGLLVVVNDERVKCQKCGNVHKFITSNCKPIAIRSDDPKGIALYGQIGTIVPIAEVNGIDVEIRDHRQDEEQGTDLFRVPSYGSKPEGDPLEGIRDPAPQDA